MLPRLGISRLGIFGGTFDPPHIGHLAAAVCARDHLGTEMLHVVVAGDPWQKSAHREVTPARHRLAMARLAFADLAGIEVSDLEVRRGGPTYTIDTVMALERCGVETVLIAGPEAARGLHTWHRHRDLAQRVTLALVQPYDGPAAPAPSSRLDGWRCVSVRMDPVEASASAARRLLAEPDRPESARRVAQMVPAAVMGYIGEHNLYKRVN